MQLPLHQIDAFTDQLFGGNPAAVMPLQDWLPDHRLQQIAAENNLSETAFLVPDRDADFRLRWFTPSIEVELCGHATLASAWWLFRHGGWTGERLRFATRSGELVARRCGERVEIDLPARPSETSDAATDLVRDALGLAPVELRRGANWIAVFEKASEIPALRPDFRRLADLHPHGLIVTAPGEDCDFVSRYFVPAHGINEDPVTGSAHADLAPYWAARLNRQQLRARQLSARGGALDVRLDGDRVFLQGDCVLYLSGTVHLPDDC